eukprot:TRINITY_DN11355_c0_g1_i1.p1 TRINITY_DN11355_c0_g1~~TRINITY_DN11355_c0_g1_i1.p1  ORF type:complete len:703 (-),score=90.43 TRINITY_DN11355_c0_g1_i1:17-2125(-)
MSVARDDCEVISLAPARQSVAPSHTHTVAQSSMSLRSASQAHTRVATSIQQLGLGRVADEQELPVTQTACIKLAEFATTRITLFWRLAFVVALPLLATVALITVSVVENASRRQEGLLQVQRCEVGTAALQLILAVQKERGRTGLFLVNATSFAEVTKQRALTDTCSYDLTTAFGSIASAHLPPTQPTQAKLSGLASHRAKITATNVTITYQQSLLYYTELITLVLRFIRELQQWMPSALLGGQTAMLGRLAAVMESFALQRPLGARMLTNTASPTDALNFAKQVSLSQILLSSLQRTSSEAYSSSLSTVPLLPSTVLVQTVAQSLLANETNGTRVSTDAWWGNVTAVLNAFIAIGDTVAADITATARTDVRNASKNMGFYLLGAFLLALLSVALLVLLVRSTNAANKRLASEVEQRQLVEESVARFIPKRFLAMLELHDVSEIRLGRRTEQMMSILFTDVVGFTTISERLSTAEAFDWVLSLTSSLSPVVARHSGTIEKYLGDAILAIFYTAQAAVQCGVDLQAEIGRQNAEADQPPIAIGVGVHTGCVCLGVVGDLHRLDTALVSPVVSGVLALEGLTRKYRAPIIISHATLADCDMSHIAFRELGTFRLKTSKGKAAPIYEVFQSDPAAVMQAKVATHKLFSAAVAAWKSGQLTKAAAYLEEAVAVSKGLDSGAQAKLTAAQTLIQCGVPLGWSGEDVW